MSKFDIEQLRLVSRIICHNDADGIASALILRDVLPDASIEFMQYDAPEHTKLMAKPGMLFCDFSPPLHRASEFIKEGAFVLDHHKTQKDCVMKFGDRGVFGKNSKLESGSMLAYREVWLPLSTSGEDATKATHRFAYLIAVRDTWQTDSVDWKESCEYSKAIEFYSIDYFFGTSKLPTKHDPWLSSSEVFVGQMLFEKKISLANEMASNVVQLDKSCIGSPCIFPDSQGLISDVAEALRTNNSNNDIVCGFYYVAENGKLRIVFSLRSLKSDVDVGAIAKANGGGGHAKAAGFSFKIAGDLNNLSPIELFELALMRWL